ncbi:MAG: hypothetical protein ACP5VS_02975 [Desulfomonilaceae bacterium]
MIGFKRAPRTNQANRPPDVDERRYPGIGREVSRTSIPGSLARVENRLNFYATFMGIRPLRSWLL